MDVIRCKDYALRNVPECPLSYINQNELSFEEFSDMFFCAKGIPDKYYKPTNGDYIRNMTDKELAVHQDLIEQTAYNCRTGGGRMTFGKENIDFLTGWFGAPEGEDYEP